VSAPGNDAFATRPAGADATDAHVAVAHAADAPATDTHAAPLRVAHLGSRGIPGRYGGYETLYEELAARLPARGCTVTVYCRPRYTPRGLREHRGARLVVLPTIPTKYFDTPVHTFLSCLHAALTGYDAVLVVNSANALFVPLLRSAGVPTALHVDGIERRRAKWGAFGRAVYALSERLAGMVADVVVSDADVIRRHYLERYGQQSVLLTYGVDPVVPPGTATLARLGVEPRRYALYVSRFEPENNPHRVVAGYAATGGELPLLMVGSAPYASAFIASFQDGADPRVRFPGAVYGDGYRELLAHAWVYVHGTEVGGTHPALVEAMGYGNCVVVNDTPENREVAGEAGVYFRAADPGTLTTALDRLRADPSEVEHRRVLACQRAAERFDWERVTDGYAALFRRLAAPPRGR
jgi:glycosyltransferase involved in cell wall biosynthesis